jgi:hypothetical protein
VLVVAYSGYSLHCKDRQPQTGPRPAHEQSFVYLLLQKDVAFLNVFETEDKLQPNTFLDPRVISATIPSIRGEAAEDSTNGYVREESRLGR